MYNWGALKIIIPCLAIKSLDYLRKLTLGIPYLDSVNRFSDLHHNPIAGPAGMLSWRVALGCLINIKGAIGFFDCA